MPDPSDKRVQFPRSNTSGNDAYVGPAGQVVVDSTRNEMRLHDGTKLGGWRFPNLTQLLRLFISSDSEMGNIAFPTEATGILARVADKTYRLRTLVGLHGLIVTNPDGLAGNPTVDLPTRLQPTYQEANVDCNTLLDSGQYVVAKAGANLPPALAGVADTALVVHAGLDLTQNVMILQSAVALSTATNTVYRRRFLAGAWSAWA